MNEAIIAELKQEAATTRRVLERVPEDRLSWKPHAKSMSLGELALHIAGIPAAIGRLVSSPTGSPPSGARPEAESVEQLLSVLDESVAAAEEIVAGWDAEAMQAEFSMVRDGKAIIRIPRKVAIRALMLNHWYHHRGQLTVYLRLLDVPLPSVYGPTADEAFG